MLLAWGRSSQGAEGGEAPLRALLRRHKLGAALPESGSNKEVWRRTPRGASPIERRDRFTRALPYHESAPEAVSYPQAPCALLLLTGRVTKPRAPTVAGARCNMAAARLAVFPTRQNLQVMKVKLTGAKKGHSLLKKKADALSMRLRALLKNIIEAKDNVGLAFREGNFALAEVKYAAGDIKPMVIESVGTAQVRAPLCVDAKCMPARLACVSLLFPPALPLPLYRVLTARVCVRASCFRLYLQRQKRVEIRVDNIAGVKVPVFKAVDTGAILQDHTGACDARPQTTASRRDGPPP